MAEDFFIYRRRLPHWRQSGCVYFVTWRLYKSQAPLTPEEKSKIGETLLFFHEQRYHLVAYVIMDDHVHVLIKPIQPYTLQQILHSWKSFTANHMHNVGSRQGCVWQDESFDRIVRDEKELQEKIHYILNNPYKRWPDIQEYLWQATFNIE